MPSNRIEDVLPKRVIDHYIKLGFPMLEEGFIVKILDMTENFVSLRDNGFLNSNLEMLKKYKKYIKIIISLEKTDKEIWYVLDNGCVLDDNDYTYYILTPLESICRYV